MMKILIVSIRALLRRLIVEDYGRVMIRVFIIIIVPFILAGCANTVKPIKQSPDALVVKQSAGSYQYYFGE